ncbi:hypothetical protein QUW50_08440 [Barnesiella viscericola]|uniref:hypothetical protein n=1 Tax=Barnesiella viscericola TaxID=397865 RepID=UPI0025A39F5D|nr:hypothetical protein [Barnesiella viscericola]MDM8269064.1 hypothetical protein [Barnesiella viscericola]
MNRLLRSIAKYFLPVLFISYIGCISLFTHTHVVNGVTIVHSHPYNPKAHHGHTTAEFQLIHALSHLTTAEPSVGVLLSAVLFAFSCRLFYPATRFAHTLRQWGAHGLRAPPVSIL